jgi:hypothetical protein
MAGMQRALMVMHHLWPYALPTLRKHRGARNSALRELLNVSAMFGGDRPLAIRHLVHERWRDVEVTRKPCASASPAGQPSFE